MTAVALKCWRCRNKTTDTQYCAMMEEIQEDREVCRSIRIGETGEDCGDDLCETCRHSAFVACVCSDYDPMRLL